MKWDFECGFKMHRRNSADERVAFVVPRLPSGLMKFPLQLEGNNESFHDFAFDTSHLGDELDFGEQCHCSLSILDRELREKVKMGTRFKIWNGGFIGEGEITRVIV